MNKNSLSILAAIKDSPGITQRELAKRLSLSPASVNQHLQIMRDKGYIVGEGREKRLSGGGIARMEQFRVSNAVILASRPGIHFLPQEDYTPKGLVKVRGERMVERLIRQLQEAGIRDITLLVGYRKEQFEYLIDQYGVRLLLVMDYADRNALSSLYHARALLGNTYICQADHYIEENPFQLYDCESWYGDMRLDKYSDEWHVSSNARGRMRGIVIGGKGGRVLLGPAHFTAEFSQAFLPFLEESALDPRYFTSPWETVLLEHLPRLPAFYVRPMAGVYKLSSLESLQEFDPAYRDGLQDRAVAFASEYFRVEKGEIQDIRRTAEGMNNASFIFTFRGERYILRLPLPGGNEVVDRRAEYNNFQTLKGSGLTDEPVYFDPDTGTKLTPYFENSRNMDDSSTHEVEQYADMLRKLHGCGRQMDHAHDFSQLIELYERLSLETGGIPYRDYEGIKARVLRLLADIRALNPPLVCCHNDAASVNFLVLEDGSMRIIDWEYGGMGDPINDIATHTIYMFASPAECERFLEIYLQRKPEQQELARLYAYMAIVGFTWSLWTVYKANLGMEFGEYGMMNYRYAKVFGQIARAMLDGEGDIPEWTVPIL